MMDAMDGQVSLAEVDDTYRAFVEKFRPKKTTDDCYTPENIYDCIADWVAEEYGADKARFVRPFWPGADYRLTEYGPEDIVVDNPPFSILAGIIGYYTARGIRFFLFGPAMTIFSGWRPGRGICYVCAGVGITYANGAEVRTSFVTNLETDGTAVRSAPELTQRVEAENEKNLKALKKQLPKYEYPDDVITAAKVQWYSQHGTPYRVKADQVLFIRGLDEQVQAGKSLFGGGFLLSEKAAAEKAAAEKAAAEKAAAHTWQLSPREREMQRKLG